MINKVPPQAVDLEKAVLGAILLEKEAFVQASEIINRDMFYIDRHATIYEAMERLSSKSHGIDMITVTQELRADNDLAYYIVSLTNSVVSSSHLTTHCQKIVETYLLRESGKIAAELYNRSFDLNADPFELMEQAEKSLHLIQQTINKNDVVRMDDTLVAIVRELEEKRHRENFITGVPTGFHALNASTCGWQPTDLVILAARPKCGKTAFALNLALNAAMEGQGIGFFSMEMSAKQLVKRILSNKASMYLQSLRDARLDDAQMVSLYSNGIQKLSGLDFFIDDTPALTVADFKAKARRLVKKYGVKMLVVDYLQLMQPERGKKNQNREQEVSTNARQLKIAAKELDVPIICLSQLSREAEKGTVPQLSHLRESGAIEQDADMVCFLYKPSEADINTDKSLEHTIYFKIAAYRNGDLQTIEFDFLGQYQRFQEKGIAEEKAPRWRPIREEDSFPTF